MKAIRRVILFVIGLLAFGLTVLALVALTGFSPRSGVQADFQRILNNAEVLNRGDTQDVSREVCGLVDVNILQSIEPQVPILPRDLSNKEPSPTYVWGVVQDKGLIEACQDHTQRYLRILIDAETLSCRAVVWVRPTCDL